MESDGVDVKPLYFAEDTKSFGGNFGHIKRLQYEIRDLEKQPVPHCTAAPTGGDIFRWQASISVPGSVYEEGTFFLSFAFPSDYPFKPPKVHFITKCAPRPARREPHVISL